LDETLLVGAGVFDKTVAVRIAGTVDPAERRLDRRPELGGGLEIAGAFGIQSGEEHEQRRRIDAAVIKPERHFA